MLYSTIPSIFRCITKPPSTDRPPTADNRPPTHRQVLYQPIDQRQPTHRQFLHRSTDHRPPTQRQFLHRRTDHRLTDSPILLQLTNNPLTHQSFFNRVTIGPILSITNFNSSFEMGTIYY